MSRDLKCNISAVSKFYHFHYESTRNSGKGKKEQPRGNVSCGEIIPFALSEFLIASPIASPIGASGGAQGKWGTKWGSNWELLSPETPDFSTFSDPPDFSQDLFSRFHYVRDKMVDRDFIEK